jgi:DNA-binding beta-propeller fold protein YncE
VAAVLGDALHRVSVLGGREGMSRSLGSVYGGSVTRFLGGGCRGVESRVIATHGVRACSNGVAVSVDGSTLLVLDYNGGSHAIHEFDVADGSQRRVIGGAGNGPLQFNRPLQVWVASDGFVFVADSGNNRVQVLTPTLDFHAFIGVGQLHRPAGVCANADIVVVSDMSGVSVFNRGDGAHLRRFGRGVLLCAVGLCFMSGGRHIAVADCGSNCVSVFSVDGEFIRRVGGGVLLNPQGVVCSAFDELVVAEYGNRRVAVLSSSGELLKTMGRGVFTGVVVHGDTIFAFTYTSAMCVVFT